MRFSLHVHAILFGVLVSAVSDLCADRPGATRGSDAWCRCNSKQELIHSKKICETEYGGRSVSCQWSEATRNCLGRNRIREAAHHVENKVGNDCPAPRGDAEKWSKTFEENKYRFTVASWNVQWLFDGVDDPEPVPSWVGKPEHVSRRVASIADVVKRMNADIYNFVEVENCVVLSDIAAHLNSSFEPFLVQGTDSALRQQVGLLSRLRPVQPIRRSSERHNYPIQGSRCGSNEAVGSLETGVSKHLVSTFSLVGGHELVIIGLHFKAIPTEPHRCSQREAQARVIRGIISEELQKGRHVIVMGDFNDLDAEVPGADGQKPTSSVLQILKDVDDDGKPELWNVLEMVPRQDRYTCWWDRNRNKRYEDGEGSMIDHILISNSLRSYVTNVGIDHGHNPEHLSDHWPVWVQFDLSTWKNSAIDNGKKPSLPEVANSSDNFAAFAFTLTVCIIGLFSFWHVRQ